MTQEFRLPDIGEGLTEADIVEWFVNVGDDVAVDQTIVEIETAKTTVEITATHAGTILSLAGSAGDTVAVGDVLFVIGEDSRQPKEGTPDSSLPQLAGGDVEERDRGGNRIETADNGSPFSVDRSPSETGGTRGKQVDGGGVNRVRTMPIVRKLAMERGIDLETLTGTGPGGTITRADIENVSTEEPMIELVAMTSKRRAIARHMAESWATIPHVTVQADIRAENLLHAREDHDDQKVSLESIVAFAVMPLLRRYPEFNAVVRGDSIEYRQHLNLGVAVDTEGGLMVVVVRDADTLSLTDLDAEISRLAEGAQTGMLHPDEVVGQTFTISNIGALGGGHGTPIIPLGTSAIFSIGRAKEAPVVEDGTLTVGLVAPADLSYDHRVIDGGLGQRFLSDLIRALETMGPSDQGR